MDRNQPSPSIDDSDEPSLSSNASIGSQGQLEEELKKTQLLNSNLRQQVNSLRAQIDELEPLGSTQKKVSTTGGDEIATIARKFCVMNECFIHDNLTSHDLKPSTTRVDIFNPTTRYVSKSSQLQGFVEEIFHVLPSNLHTALAHSKIFKQFKRAHCNERSHQISRIRENAPRIFASLGTFTAEQFAPNSTSRQEDLTFRPLVGADERYPAWAPLLFPDLNTKNMDKVFAAPCIRLLLKFMLFKTRAFDSDGSKKTFSGAKPAGKAWGITSVSPGFVAFGAILARFLFSPDNKFEAKGDISSINYAEDFITYKRFLLAGLQQKIPAIITLFKTLNGHLFGDEEIIDTPRAQDNSEDNSDATLTNADFDDAMQRLLEGPPAQAEGPELESNTTSALSPSTSTSTPTITREREREREGKRNE
ncbi:hypothetical protein M378DRAFT_18291 [Amanita muscaria Koide BX008]|uniref:FIP-RBD domain-containing protein n=1 Tax=Amanita muscaria (strain Koide BX008) TaxID=946122 RepID=A0A0C2SM89_AMAMK|nr:hypothetical protein M378DRAFT_18291 [Amanita muscaria Koide BX008]